MQREFNQIAKYRYMSGGQFKTPLTIRSAQGGGAGFGTQHSQCAESWLASFPGIKVVSPANPAEAYGLLRGAIRDDNPVFVLEHKMLYNMKGMVAENAGPIPIGKARIARPGKDVTMVSFSMGMRYATQATEKLVAAGVDVELIDLRTLRPMDSATVIESVKKTGRIRV